MQAPGLQEPAKKALATLDREWDGLAAHRDYPMVSLDNNAAERMIRGPVVTRKNARGSHNGDTARNAAVIWTVTGTAQMAGLNILTYLPRRMRTQRQESGSPAILVSAVNGQEIRSVRGRAHTGAMAAWKDVEQAEPDFAARVRRLFDAGRHKTIATLRADGSPRISGIECRFADGELRFGSMPGARKGADLRRDPRFALHGPTFHPQQGKEAGWPGEAKIAGRAVLAGPIGEGPAGDLFVADISEVVTTRLNPEATVLVIESWTPQRGLRVVERE
jgi:hypothetical protein